MIKEVCVESFSEALAAEKRGADRIELCDNLYLGGTTPSYGTIKMAMEKLTIPAFPIIRPRGGNFHYSKEEIEIMKEDIKVCKSLGAKGVVLGVLTADNKVDFETLKELVELASPMEVTFHKAVDELENPVEVIDRFVEIGVKRILSSGTKETALEGKDILNAMIKKADNRIIILIAGKVTSDNFEEVAAAIPSTEYHGKKII
ncbi:copper homeostasis protein CutC [Fusobacterium varium]|jgi:copper homeostasis protein|uniref:PF03932 family protein CutC n=1 Tax=Fusobacterium varium ATCC 27725 TaxID=469618 RepID=A0ABN5JF55_FUSVA|nr:copper homeostasis protein CutC [Fusobacterium varium]AVQ30741.1 copper homeostasis protein CutC [Fusobacterium varium ATCC 27725]EES64167.1 putative copper homeostasis protein CutC [Fusobacterium varium ATCC 27725]MCF0171176.1 copper homeostasis protein CutC [Fusobacterium varium]VEH40640.1 Copper homeostasis protein CutC [Fusobacterium varium]